MTTRDPLRKLGSNNGSHTMLFRSPSPWALAARICMLAPAHAASCLTLPTAQARAVGGDARRRAPFEQGGLECRLQPAPRLADTDRKHASRMQAQTVPTKFHTGLRPVGRSSSCRPKTWPILLFRSRKIQAHAATSFMLPG